MKKKSPLKAIIISFLLGMVVMYLLDMKFHFNSTQVEKDVQKLRKGLNELIDSK